MCMGVDFLVTLYLGMLVELFLSVGWLVYIGCRLIFCIDFYPYNITKSSVGILFSTIEN